SETKKPEKIAVLGGGMGSLATVFELTNDPDWQQKYDITVYQLGWRLGGKGASGRGECDRVEEHGLHVWFGFYQNAFSFIRKCFEEYQRLGCYPDSPIRTLEQAFRPESLFVYEEYIGSKWLEWDQYFKVTPGV